MRSAAIILNGGIWLMVTTAIAAPGSAQTAREVRGPTALLAIQNEAPPRLIVDEPLAEPLAAGRVFIQYRAQNMRIVPVFGTGALQVSPRIGHVHITVDGASWHFVDASGETIILVGLSPGPHKVLIELADPTHKVVDRQEISFVVPPPESFMPPK
jgi:Family of unknown function (DUF6130)